MIDPFRNAYEMHHRSCRTETWLNRCVGFTGGIRYVARWTNEIDSPAEPHFVTCWKERKHETSGDRPTATRVSTIDMEGLATLFEMDCSVTVVTARTELMAHGNLHDR